VSSSGAANARSSGICWSHQIGQTRNGRTHPGRTNRTRPRAAGPGSRQPARALAAAFICFLYSRTRSRVETSVMSAMDRKPPSSPNGADVSRHPARGHAKLLAQERHKNLGLLLAEARQRRNPLQQFLPVGRGRPHPGRVAVVGVHDELAHGLHPLGHRAREAVQRRHLREDRLQGVGVVLRQLLRVQRLAETAGQFLGSGEGTLKRNLLVPISLGTVEQTPILCAPEQTNVAGIPTPSSAASGVSAGTARVPGLPERASQDPPSESSKIDVSATPRGYNPLQRNGRRPMEG